eukprot:CAMPEP_0194270386 /NCGR_PEP_ID=MMETSP0169-20130528/4375_1 /TAXON_ID=218684 /ORGANISM="Corethron pennatum, Strain L29A3" /LENGTH=399 /DNA_ID=CAMNT_0039012411 /DNA_START=33 /DNA_END=1228 /DNA_ORIENTATION=-
MVYYRRNNPAEEKNEPSSSETNSSAYYFQTSNIRGSSTVVPGDYCCTPSWLLRCCAADNAPIPMPSHGPSHMVQSGTDGLGETEGRQDGVSGRSCFDTLDGPEPDPQHRHTRIPTDGDGLSAAMTDARKRNMGCREIRRLFGGTPVEELYIVNEKIGSGVFSTVVRAQSRTDDGQQYAIKAIDISKTTPGGRLPLRSDSTPIVAREISIMRSLEGRHPGIMSLFEVIADDTRNMLFLVMPHASGGDLHERLQRTGPLGEDDASELFRGVATAVKFCHDRGVVHRDIKPENIVLMVREREEGNTTTGKAAAAAALRPVLCDFGCAARTGPAGGFPDALTTMCGTPEYAAPEMVLGVPYGKPVDVWGCGVVLFCLLCGHRGAYDAITGAGFPRGRMSSEAR